MPKFLEKKLRAHVPTGVDADRYVYGAMNNIGAMRGSKETAKGRAMERKHLSQRAAMRVGKKVRNVS